jgi:hypothetical protein
MYRNRDKQVQEQHNKDRIRTGTGTCRYMNSRTRIGYVQEQRHASTGTAEEI